jgi:hypothetical protein
MNCSESKSANVSIIPETIWDRFPAPPLADFLDMMEPHQPATPEEENDQSSEDEEEHQSNTALPAKSDLAIKIDILQGYRFVDVVCPRCNQTRAVRKNQNFRLVCDNCVIVPKFIKKIVPK